jgi:malonyl-CoA O-methyltransferase
MSASSPETAAPPRAAPAPEEFRLDRPAVAAAFDRASGAYDAAARLQREVGAELLGRLDFFRLEPAVVLDLGAGTGAATAELARRFRRARVIALDVAPGMLRAARRRWRPWRRFARVCGDAHALPLRSASVDLVFSNLMLQWSDRPDAVFAECARVLRPGGLLLFSTFGPETLQELRAAWASVDAAPRVSVFPDMPELAAALQRARFAEPVLDTERQLRHYGDVRALLQELRRIGARNAAAARARGLTGPRTLGRMIASYELRRDARGIPATWEIIHGAAFGGAAETGAAGEAYVPISSIRRRSGEG